MPERTTTIRLTDEDQAVIEELQKDTGIQSTTELIRLALRETLKQRRRPAPAPRRSVGVAVTRSGARKR